MFIKTKNKKEPKVYEYKNIWVDTKPLYIDNLTKSISLYKAAPLNIVTFKQGNLKSSRLLTVLQVLIRLHHLIDLGWIFIILCSYYIVLSVNILLKGLKTVNNLTVLVIKIKLLN